jgi:hypothetical protein
VPIRSKSSSHERASATLAVAEVLGVPLLADDRVCF